VIRGNASIERDDDYTFARRFGVKYDNADLSVHDGPGESRVVITIEPVSVFPVKMR
jgi:hypothetical protein